MSTMEPATDDRPTDVDYAVLARVIAVINGKGGVGKTSIVANTGHRLSTWGYKVLLVGIDPQDNLGEDLSYTHTNDTDDGQNLAHAILGEAALVPKKDVRPNLDVIPGGDAIEELVLPKLYNEQIQLTALAAALEPLAGDYDVILLDCPPGYHGLQHLALVAARWMLVPTATDASSRKGLARLGQRVLTASAYNPNIALLGVVLFDLPANASRIRDRALRSIRDDLQTEAPLFTSFIRTATAAADDARERGQVMAELARDVAAAGPFWKRDKKSGPALARSASSVDADYEKLATETIQALVAAEGAQS